MARRSTKPKAAKPSADEPSLEELYQKARYRAIQDAYGFIVPTEFLKPERKRTPVEVEPPPFEYSVKQLRQQWIEAMIEQGVGRYEAMMAKPRMTRAEIAHERAHRRRAPGKYYPVSRAEVEAAREAAYRCGVTFSTYMNWHLLRRNYEADPTVLQNGPWRQVVRDPLPAMRFGLGGVLLRPGASLLGLADYIDSLGENRTEWQSLVRSEISSIFVDMDRPLRPRRTPLRTARDGTSD